MLNIWMPLDGDLKNQGLSQNTPIAISGGTFVDGKIGQCYSSNGVGYINLNNNVEINGCFSLCTWVKVNELAEWGRVFHFQDDSNSYFGMNMNNSSTNPKFGFHSMKNIDGTSTRLIDTYQFNISVGLWTHVAVVVNQNNIYLYQDGKLIFKTIIGNTIDGIFNHNYLCVRYPLGSKLNCCIQDFRFYNQALSPREVKLISQALCMHYPMTRGGFGQDNLLRYTNQGATGWSWATKKSDKKVELYETTGVKMTMTADAPSDTWCILLYDDGYIKDVIQPGEKYVISFDIKVSFDLKNGVYTDIRDGNSQNAVFTVGSEDKKQVPKNEWVHLVYYKTAKDSFTVSNQEVYIGLPNIVPVTGDEVCLKNLKIEPGEIATPWTPHPEDILYTAMGLDDGILYDVSGYQNNCFASPNPPTFSADSIRYGLCSEFNGTDNWYYMGKKMWLNDELTLTCWAYLDDWTTCTGSIISCVEAGGWGFQKLNGNANLGFPIGTGVSSNTYRTSTIPLSSFSTGWHFFGLTYDGYKATVYIDGVVNSISAEYSTKTPIFYSTNVNNNGLFIGGESGGNSGLITPDEKFNGKISDVRIYATALSADDILELYNTPISLASNGTLLSNTFSES